MSEYDRAARHRLDEPPLDLGNCCGCGKTGPAVRNLLSLRQKSPTPGRGWGCLQCGLPPDGAQAVLCDACMFRIHAGEAVEAVVKEACRGYPRTDGRLPYGLLAGLHEHNLAMHPEVGDLDC